MAHSLLFARSRTGLSELFVRTADPLRGAARKLALPALLAVGGISALVAGFPGAPDARLQSKLPEPPPMAIRPMRADHALELNAQIPVAGGPSPAAAPFMAQGNAESRAQAVNCLASAVYYEAGNQDESGERAVAQVVLNRVRHPAFPASVCGVVYQGSTRATGCQFTFTCDGSLYQQPSAEGWRRARRIAEQALTGAVYAPVGWSTHYHANYVVPYWATTMTKNAVVGAHLFYRWAGSWGRPAIFTRAYAGREPSESALRSAALAAVHIIPAQPASVAAAINLMPGAEPLKLSPSMRGDKRVAVRFNLAARKASDDVRPPEYDKQFQASDNLKWSLSSDSAGQNQVPLGRAAESGSGAGSANGASAER